MDIKEVQEDLKEMLTEKRYLHCVGTMKMAKILAKKYGEDENEAEFAGLIHDIAKEMSLEDAEKYITSHNIKIDEIEDKQKALLHAKLGASIAKEKYGASLKVQNAILYHTTGNKEMDTFAKIIYVADKIEENRTYEGVEELRKSAMENLDDAILEIIDFVLKKSINNQRLIHPDTVELRNFLIMKNM